MYRLKLFNRDNVIKFFLIVVLPRNYSFIETEILFATMLHIIYFWDFTGILNSKKNEFEAAI
jgi:hypothetical protein